MQGTTFLFTNNGSQITITGGALQPGDTITADNATSAAASPSSHSRQLSYNIKQCNHNEWRHVMLRATIL